MRSSDRSTAATAVVLPSLIVRLCAEPVRRSLAKADHPITRGTLKRPASSAASGALASSSDRDSVGRRHVVAIDRTIQHLRGRRDAGRVERANLFDVGQDVAELPGEQVELLGA